MRKVIVPGALGILLGAAIVWLFLSRAQLTHGGPRNLTIGIYTPSGGTSCQVDFPDAVVSIARNDKIVWESEDNAYTIRFASSGTCSSTAGTPFTQDPLPTILPLGSITPTFAAPREKGYFCYEVFAGSTTTGTPCSDPGLHVKD